LSFVKGRINFNTYINENLARGRNHKLNCTYDSFEMDNEFNQCIKFVSKMLLSASKDYQNKRNLSDIVFLLDEVSDTAIASDVCKRMQFNPMFSSFETVRDYCVLFLENSISFNYKNDLKLFAFLLPMEYVFEDFLYGFIEKEIEGVNPKGQVSGTFLDEAKNFGLKPDLILDLGNKLIIADTKYKIVYSDEFDPKKGISQSDLYQMLAYAVRFGIKEVKLFYPNTISTAFQIDFANIQIKDTLALGEQISISAHQIPIIDNSITVATLLQSDKLLDCFEGLKERLNTKLKEILILE
jgi:5-methylcytosine-specific restriction enzyme subunit McrC